MAEARGRPKGSFTQHRRMEGLRRVLEQHPNGLPLSKIASALSMSERSARRYLKQAEAELHLVAEKRAGERHAWFSIPAGELRRRVELRYAQATLLMAGRRLFDLLRGSGLFDEVELAMRELEVVARHPGRRRRGLASGGGETERLAYLPEHPKAYETKSEELHALFDAVSRLHPVMFKYRSPRTHAVCSVAVHPYAVVMHRDTIYCVGADQRTGKIEAFGLEFVRDVECDTKKTFRIPPDFELEDFRQGVFGIWREPAVIRVVLEFDRVGAERLHLSRVHPSQQHSATQQGGMRLVLSVGRLDEVLGWVLGFGAHVRCLEPRELRDRLEREIAAMARLYAGRN